ncbi:MAG TPA: hypothetical protein VFS84_01680, partial [Candidatus Binatia bacterium]|nr:hypothetical protein [Candidatus Binatia bacterium]
MAPRTVPEAFSSSVLVSSFLPIIKISEFQNCLSLLASFAVRRNYFHVPGILDTWNFPIISKSL